MKIRKPSALAAALILLLPDLDCLAAVATRPGGTPAPQVVVAPLTGAAPSILAPAPALPSAEPALAASLVPSPAIRTSPISAAPMAEVAKMTEELRPQLESIDKPTTSAAEAAGAGRNIESIVTKRREAPSTPEAAPAVETGVGEAPASVFTPLSRPRREAFVRRYMAHLRRRDGEPDWSDRRNPKFEIRERFFQELEKGPVRFSGAPLVDQAEFTRLEASHEAKTKDRLMLWTLAVAKSNRSEFYGVMQGLGRMLRAMKGPDDPMRYIGVEEFYHTRILKDAVGVLGVEMRLLPPHWQTRLALQAIIRLPKFLSNVLILCAEIAGVAAFRMLADEATRLLPQEEAPQKRVQQLFQQILVDEVGHVHFIRSQLGPVRLWIAKKILPVFTRVFLRDIPEVVALYGRENLMRAVIAADVDSAAVKYEDRFVPFENQPSK